MSLLVLPAPMAGGRLPPEGTQHFSKTASVGTMSFPSCHRDSPQTWATSFSRAPMGPSMAAHKAPHTPQAPRWQRLGVLGFTCRVARGANPSRLLAILKPEGCSCTGGLAQSPNSHPSWYRTTHGLKNNEHHCSVTLPCSKGFKNPPLSGLLNQLVDPLLVCGHLPLLL